MGYIPTVLRMVPMRVFPKPVYHDQYMWNSRIVATTPEYQDINKLEVAAGRFLVDQRRPDAGKLLRARLQRRRPAVSLRQPHRRDGPDRQVQLSGRRRGGGAHADGRQRRQPGRRGLQQRRLHPDGHAPNCSSARRFSYVRRARAAASRSNTARSRSPSATPRKYARRARRSRRSWSDVRSPAGQPPPPGHRADRAAGPPGGGGTGQGPLHTAPG